MHISVDSEACAGCGRCTGLLSGLIEMGEDQRARAIPGSGEADPDLILNAVLSCPTGALSREE